MHFGFYEVFFFQVHFCKAKTNLKVLLDATRGEALWDDHHTSLHIEPQGHLGCVLVVLLRN